MLKGPPQVRVKVGVRDSAHGDRPNRDQKIQIPRRRNDVEDERRVRTRDEKINCEVVEIMKPSFKFIRNFIAVRHEVIKCAHSENPEACDAKRKAGPKVTAVGMAKCRFGEDEQSDDSRDQANQMQLRRNRTLEKHFPRVIVMLFDMAPCARFRIE